MDHALTLGLGIVLLWSIYYAIRIGTLDPHNLRSHLSTWQARLLACGSFACLAMFMGAKQTDPELASFFAMFVLGQTVAPAFTGGEDYREDEERSALMRTMLKLKARVAGSLLMTLLSLLLAYTIGLLIGDWWYVVLLVVGFMLVKSKATIAKMMIAADDGELSRLPKQMAHNVSKVVAKTFVYGSIGYLVAGVALGWVLFQEAGLQPSNWSGWLGLLLGSVLHWEP